MLTQFIVTRIWRQLPSGERVRLTRALRHLVAAAGENYGPIPGQSRGG